MEMMEAEKLLKVVFKPMLKQAEIRLPASVPPYKMRGQHYTYQIDANTDAEALARKIDADCLQENGDPIELSGTIQFIEKALDYLGVEKEVGK